nr:MAG TPA: Protein of unknown function (DUF3951) [Caudoviricetes sp.]
MLLLLPLIAYFIYLLFSKKKLSNNNYFSLYRTFKEQ